MKDIHSPILVTSIKAVQPGILEAVRQALASAFGLPTCTGPVLDDIDFAFHFSRNQYHSTAILQALDQAVQPSFQKILAVTDVDLFIPILTHVFGEAQMGGRAGLISTYRLWDDLPAQNPHQTFLHRVSKEAIHELGHTFNLRHCQDPACLMHYCRSMPDVDHKDQSFCRYCRILLDEALQDLGSPG